jgi:hypothetical protein
MALRDYPSNGEAQVVLLAAMSEAAALGWKEGRRIWRFTIDCPFSFRNPALCQAWLFGFGEGRTCVPKPWSGNRRRTV